MKEKEVALGLLARMGIAMPSEVPAGRAFRRLKAKLDEKGVPEDLTAEEQALLQSEVFNAVATREETHSAPVETGEESKEESKIENEPGVEGEKKPKAHRGRSGSGGIKAFREFFSVCSVATRKEAVEQISAQTGLKPYCIGNYIALAKNPMNPFGFQLVEEKGENGEKTLRVVASVPVAEESK